MLIQLVAFVGIVSFPGGDANEFAKSLGEATHQNIVLCQSQVTPVAKVDYDPSDLTAMARALRAKTGLAIAPGVRLTLNDGLVPVHRILNADFQSETPKWKELGEDAIKNGKVTFETKDKERLDPASLATAHFSKPVTVHWFFAQTPVSVWAHDMPEDEFLTYLAKSVGGQLVSSPKAYTIDFDPAEIRRRAIKRIDAWPSQLARSDEDEAIGQQKRLKLIVSILNAATTGTIYEAFKTEGGSAKFTVNRESPVVSLFGDFTKPLTQPDPEGGSGFKTPTGFIHFPEQLDAAKAIELTLRSNFTTALLCHYRDASGKPGTFSFDFSN